VSRKTFPFLAKLGSGSITGASDVDPSGIATYSKVGVQPSLIYTVIGARGK
jgi:Mn2+/Fe2+ NRAMP family transporter